MGSLEARIGRRALLLGAAGAAASVAHRASALDLPSLPVSIAVASNAGGGEVVDQAFLDEECRKVTELFSAAGIHFDFARAPALEATYARLENRKDRDSLSAFVVPHEVSIFVVDSLRDVDDPKLYRMGVTWRSFAATSTCYVIVASSALSTTMAHELGHFFGLDHTFEKNNLMSYDRDGAKVFLADNQLRKIRTTAAGMLATKTLVPR